MPDEAPLGLRVYGARRARAARGGVPRHGARRAPSRPATAASSAAVEALEGKGRTPIGRSLLATPGDFADGAATR